MKDRESEEMYLETIFLLSKKNVNVRSVDIVNEREMAKSSVSRGVNLLQERGYITIDSDTGIIKFTKKGFERANNIYDKHQVFTQIFIEYGASKELAEENACRIEHVIDEELFELIKKKHQKQ